MLADRGVKCRRVRLSVCEHAPGAGICSERAKKEKKLARGKSGRPSSYSSVLSFSTSFVWLVAVRPPGQLVLAFFSRRAPARLYWKVKTRGGDPDCNEGSLCAQKRTKSRSRKKKDQQEKPNHTSPPHNLSRTYIFLLLVHDAYLTNMLPNTGRGGGWTALICLSIICVRASARHPLLASVSTEEEKKRSPQGTCIKYPEFRALWWPRLHVKINRLHRTRCCCSPVCWTPEKESARLM